MKSSNQLLDSCQWDANLEIFQRRQTTEKTLTDVFRDHLTPLLPSEDDFQVALVLLIQ